MIRKVGDGQFAEVYEVEDAISGSKVRVVEDVGGRGRRRLGGGGRAAERVGREGGWLGVVGKRSGAVGR